MVKMIGRRKIPNGDGPYRTPSKPKEFKKRVNMLKMFEPLVKYVKENWFIILCCVLILGIVTMGINGCLTRQENCERLCTRSGLVYFNNSGNQCCCIDDDGIIHDYFRGHNGIYGRSQ